MKEDFDLEEELAKSIASIVDEETADAEAYVKKNGVKDIPYEESESRDDEDENTEFSSIEEPQEDKVSGKKIAIIIVIVVAAVAIIGVAAYFAVNAAFNKSKDNYGYYNGLGYEAYDNKDYDTAIENFEKALTYDEGKSDSDTNINMMLYLYECYNNTSQTEKAENMLKEVLVLDEENENAYYNLMSMYDEAEDYTALSKLYDMAVDTGNKDLTGMFGKYIPEEPEATPVGGDFNDDQKVFLSGGSDCKIYYTTDGSNPKDNAQVFTDRIELQEGTSTISFYAVNEYGFESPVMEETYNISYLGPKTPSISPTETNFSQSSKVMVTISNVDQGSKVYYTLDGSTPTTSSTEYNNKPFELPAGTTVVTVLVVDEHGKTSTNSKTYSVAYVAKYTKDEAEEFIWSMLIEKKYVDEDHIDKKDNECSMDYYSQKLIDDKSIYMFYYNVDDEVQDYWYGADAETGDVYKITGTKDDYKLSKIK